LRVVDSLHLPLLEPHRTTLEKCVYCPKLSRAACPVSNVEANETVTPWGKMSMAYFAARGDVPVDAVHAAPAWACSACFGCRERCDHKNDVATALEDARAEFFERGVAPEGARAVASRWSERSRAAAEVLAGVDDGHIEGDRTGRALLLVGCGYARHALSTARDALRATAILLGRSVRPVRACCGLPLLYAGDRAGFIAAARRLAAEVGAEQPARFVALDPGCARALRVDYARVGVDVLEPELFVDVAFSGRDRLRRLPAGIANRSYRYHDPCQLGRGLDRYDQPRALLEQLTGRHPSSFVRHRRHGECSGAGGLLPATRPSSSRAIADERIAEHRELGGGVLVTACAQSLHRFRTRGEPAEDLASLVARAL
jgi:Fe-S oxidoreductase